MNTSFYKSTKSADPAVGGDDLLINYGSAIKSTKDGHIGGYLVIFSDAAEPDLDGDFFTAKTDFGIENGAKTAVWLHHRRPLKTRSDQFITVKEKIGEGTLSIDDKGVLIDAILFQREQYEDVLEAMGWSSGTASHLVERKGAGKASEILMWPLGLDASVTPSPAQPQKTAVAFKTFQTLLYGDELELPAAPAAEKRWTVSERKNFPDACFAYIAPGGTLDSEGKTTPRNLRFFPIKDAEGVLSSTQVRNALKMIPQSALPAAAQKKAMKAVAQAAKKLGLVIDAEAPAEKSFEFKGMYRDELESRYANIYSLTDVLTCVLYRLSYLEESADELGIVIDAPALRAEILVEFGEALELYYEKKEELENKSLGFVFEGPKVVTKHIEFVTSLVRDFEVRGRAITQDVEELVARCKSTEASATIRGQIEDAHAALQSTMTGLKASADQVAALRDTLDPERRDHAKKCAAAVLDYMEAESKLVTPIPVDQTSTANS